MTSLNLIAKHCTAFERSVEKGPGMKTEDITTATKLEIPKYVSDGKYEDLNNILGAALPEVTELRYYTLTCNEDKKTITLKDLRHLIMWQLWIKHFIDHYPNFHGEMKDAYGRGRFDRIGNFLFTKNLCIEHMTASDLGKGLGYDPKEPTIKSEEDKKKKTYQNQLDAYNEEKKQMQNDFEKIKNLDAEHRLEWYLQRMLERLANKKKDVLDMQDVLGRPNDIDGKLSNNVRHLLNFLTYISSTEEETRENIKILNQLEPSDHFIHTIRNINNLVTIVGNLHSTKLLNIIKQWHNKRKYPGLLQRWVRKYDNICNIPYRSTGLNTKRIKYIIKKHYFEQIMKFLAKYGMNPTHDTYCINDYNKMFKSAIEQCHNGDFITKNFQKKYLRGFKKKLPDKWECYCTTDVFFNFVSWYLSSKIEKTKPDDFFRLIEIYLTDVNEENTPNVTNKESFKVDEWDIFKIGDGLFTNDAKNKESIDDHLTNDNNKEDNEEDNDDDDEDESESQDEGSTDDSEEEVEREAITSLKDARDVHDVTMLLLHKFIEGLSDDKQRQEMSKVLENMESLQGDTEIGTGQYEVDNVLKEFLGEENKDQD